MASVSNKILLRQKAWYKKAVYFFFTSYIYDQKPSWSELMSLPRNVYLIHLSINWWYVRRKK